MAHTCLRCHGLIIREACETDEGTCEGWRCVRCGDHVDPGVLAHRQLPIAPTPYDDAVLPVWDPEAQVLRVIQQREAKRHEAGR